MPPCRSTCPDRTNTGSSASTCTSSPRAAARRRPRPKPGHNLSQRARRHNPQPQGGAQKSASDGTSEIPWPTLNSDQALRSMHMRASPFRGDSLDVDRPSAVDMDTHLPEARSVQVDAQAFWLRGPGSGEIRALTLPGPEQNEVMVRTLRSGVSRGTETLVFRGGVPPDQYAAMRAPFQEGDFPGPVKYGYLNVGTVEQGPPELRGRTVFCLYPHQTRYVVPAAAVTVVPDDVPPARAVLAGTVETAVNALWDAAPMIGHRVAVVGAGMLGCCVARLLAGFPALAVTLVDVESSRAGVSAALCPCFPRTED